MKAMVCLFVSVYSPHKSCQFRGLLGSLSPLGALSRHFDLHHHPTPLSMVRREIERESGERESGERESGMSFIAMCVEKPRRGKERGRGSK